MSFNGGGKETETDRQMAPSVNVREREQIDSRPPGGLIGLIDHHLRKSGFVWNFQCGKTFQICFFVVHSRSCKRILAPCSRPHLF